MYSVYDYQNLLFGGAVEAFGSYLLSQRIVLERRWSIRLVLTVTGYPFILLNLSICERANHFSPGPSMARLKKSPHIPLDKNRSSICDNPDTMLRPVKF